MLGFVVCVDKLGKIEIWFTFVNKRKQEEESENERQADFRIRAELCNFAADKKARMIPEIHI